MIKLCGGGVSFCGFVPKILLRPFPHHTYLIPPTKTFSEYHAPPNSCPPILRAWVTFPAEKKFWSWGHFLGPGTTPPTTSFSHHLSPPFPHQAMTTDTKKKAWRVASKAGKKGDAIAAVKGRRLLLRTFSEPVPAGKGKLCECVCLCIGREGWGLYTPTALPLALPRAAHPLPRSHPPLTHPPTLSHPHPFLPSQTQGTPRRM